MEKEKSLIINQISLPKKQHRMTENKKSDLRCWSSLYTLYNVSFTNQPAHKISNKRDILSKTIA